MKALALLVLGSVFSAVGASDVGCEPGSGIVTAQDDCDSAGAAPSIDRLEVVRDACGSTNIALECKELASGAFAIVIASGQAGSTSSKRKQVLAGKLFFSFFFLFPFPCSFSHVHCAPTLHRYRVVTNIRRTSMHSGFKTSISIHRTCLLRATTHSPNSKAWCSV